MNHKTKVNTEKNRLQANLSTCTSNNGTSIAPDHSSEIILQAHDIVEHAGRVRILLNEIVGKVDAGRPLAPDVIECFAICAGRGAELIEEAADQIARMAQPGGAA